MFFGHRQRQHKGIGIHMATRKMQQATEGDRQHEHVYRKHIGGEQPDRFVQMLLVEVFDHRDLKLPRQEHDRHH